MLANFFKKTGHKEDTPPALTRLNQMGAHSAVCTMVRTADGRETHAEVGPVSFYRRDNQLYIRDRAMFLVPPSISPDQLPFSGRGEILNLRFQYGRTPYSLNCEVVQRVRFSDRLLGGLEPRTPIGYKLHPLSNIYKNENRGSLRFAQMRGAKGPQVFPHFRFDLFVEQVHFNGLAHEMTPAIVPFPGDDHISADLPENALPEDLVHYFHTVLRTHSEQQRQVHISLISRETRTRITDLTDLGYVDVLGLSGSQKSGLVHLRHPMTGKRGETKTACPLSEGDVLVLRFTKRGLVQSSDVYYRWMCRIQKCGLETLTLRPLSAIQQQTGLPVLVRDFCVGGVGLQNSPMLESYLMGNEPVPNDPDALFDALMGMGLLLHFYPRLYFPGDVAIYQPRIPAAFSLLGEIVRGCFDKVKNKERLMGLGVAFRHDPADYDPQTLAVMAWEPLRGLRESAHFKEIHRALNSLIAFSENR